MASLLQNLEDIGIYVFLPHLHFKATTWSLAVSHPSDPSTNVKYKLLQATEIITMMYLPTDLTAENHMQYNPCLYKSSKPLVWLQTQSYMQCSQVSSNQSTANPRVILIAEFIQLHQFPVIPTGSTGHLQASLCWTLTPIAKRYKAWSGQNIYEIDVLSIRIDPSGVL